MEMQHPGLTVRHLHAGHHACAHSQAVPADGVPAGAGAGRGQGRAGHACGCTFVTPGGCPGSRPAAPPTHPPANLASRLTRPPPPPPAAPAAPPAPAARCSPRTPRPPLQAGRGRQGRSHGHAGMGTGRGGRRRASVANWLQGGGKPRAADVVARLPPRQPRLTLQERDIALGANGQHLQEAREQSGEVEAGRSAGGTLSTTTCSALKEQARRQLRTLAGYFSSSPRRFSWTCSQDQAGREAGRQAGMKTSTVLLCVQHRHSPASEDSGAGSGCGGCTWVL